jgi:hypothetical protein
MLARREAYLATGGHQAVRPTLHDGIKLARLMKTSGLRIAVFDGADVARCRMYVGLRATWRGFTRNAYEALGSPLALATMVTLSAVRFIVPLLALPLLWLGEGHHSPATTRWALAACVALAVRTIVALRCRHPAWTILATPLAVALMIDIQLHSFFNHITGRRVVWRAHLLAGRALTWGPASGPARSLELDLAAAHLVVAVRAEIADLEGGLTVSVHQRGLPVQVTGSPDGKGAHHNSQLTATLREEVLGAGRMLGVEATGHDAVLLQSLQPGGEHVGCDAGKGLLKIPETAWASEEIAHDEQGPALTQQLHGLRHRTGLLVLLGHESL